MAQYFLIAKCSNSSFTKDTAQHHQLALGLSAEWSLLGDGWIPPLFWFSGPSLHDGALSLRSVPGGSWERESPARLQQPSLWSSGHHRCHSGLDTSTSDLQIGHGPPVTASLSFVHIFVSQIISGVIHQSEKDTIWKYATQDSFFTAIIHWASQSNAAAQQNIYLWTIHLN